MQMIKFLILLIVLVLSTYIGILMSKKYLNRVKDLKEIKKGLNIFETKIKFTYEPIPQIFNDISNTLNNNIGNIFLNSSNKMKEIKAGDAWIQAINESNNSFNNEDIETIKGLSSLLGKVDMEGQISEIELVSNLLNSQLEIAESEKNKYSKMYKTLGIAIGLAIIIILI